MFNPAAATLPILEQADAPPPFARRIEELRRTLLPLDEAAAIGRFALGPFDRILKSTISLCPHCLEHIAALVYSLDGRVWMQKQCPQHGFTSAVIENDERFYFLSNKDCSGRRYAVDRVLEFPEYNGGCCATAGNCQTAAEPAAGMPDSVGQDFTDQMGNKSCTVLVEITNACNLSCKVCYSDARGDRVMPLEVFQRYLHRLCEQKGGLDSVQLTGGEAILHPQFWEIVAWLHRQEGVRKIYLPTNGILFASAENAARLVPFRDKLMLLLQFDGRKTATNLSLRNANPTKIRLAVIEQLAAAGVIMQLTMTLTKGVNDDEIGWVIDTAMRHPHVKVVAL
ncbi:MAG TPA: radical SAM protein, partial [Planctomycetaceae bacterium]